MSLDGQWFTEEVPVAGSAFSLKVKRKLHDEQSPFQRIEVYETEHFGNLMTLDGMVMLTTRDNFLYHEMMSHPALFTHPNPRRVLIIGGGDCGTLREVLKHPGVQKAEQVDIDEGVTRASELYFPELCESNGDPRASLHFDDGIKWVRDAKPGTYDLIIVDSTDPIGPAEGLFSKQFYEDCFRALGPHGMVVQQSESPLYHMLLIKQMYDAIRGAGFADVSTLFFPQAVYPSGWWSATMTCKDQMFNGFREQDAAKKGFKTQYYNAAIHRGALAAPEFFASQVTP
ncbi:MAG: polyamine aminopropyltransferase [Gammaproteobacteria bacterium]|nr:polyamine aminopropyltransferase [Gammaproteobacteria bacterium]